MDRHFYREKYGYKQPERGQLPNLDGAFECAWDEAVSELKAVEMKKRMTVMMIARLKNFEAERNDLDELVELAAYGKLISATYVDSNLPIPEWLATNVGAVAVEIKRRNQDYLAKQLKETEAELATLKTREEKRAELADKQAKLKQLLGQ